MDKYDARKLANELKAQFAIGKNGITDTYIKTINEYLDAHQIVKIKVNIASDKAEAAYFADEIASQTKSEVAEKKGFTFTIFRPKKR